MSDAIKAGTNRTELDKAFKYAVILAWDDLMKATKPCAIHVEYLFEPGVALDHVSVWSVGAGGYQDLLCDYWTWSSSAHPTGIRFANRYSSEKLAQILDFVIKNQDQFTHPADACRHGLVQILPPSEDDRAEATTWTRGALGIALNLVGAAHEARTGEVLQRPEDQRGDEEASWRMAEEGCPNEGAAILPHGTEASLRTAA